MGQAGVGRKRVRGTLLSVAIAGGILAGSAQAQIPPLPGAELGQVPILDGRIAYTSTQIPDGGECCQKGLRTILSDGSGDAAVTPPRGIGVGDADPAYSPEGLRIAWVAWNRAGSGFNFEADIYAMLADGSFPVLVTQDPSIHVGGAPNGGPAWSPLGDRIAYAAAIKDSSALGLNLDIVTTRIDGLDTVNLTRTPGFLEFEPEFSPDGSRIAFVGLKPEGIPSPSIWVARADGSNPRMLIAGNFPTWSPDGTRIAFVSAEPGQASDIYTIDANGGPVTRVTSNPAQEIWPSYSPDGTHLAFSSDREETGTSAHRPTSVPQNDVFLAPAGGGDAFNVTRNLDYGDGPIDWGPVASGAVAPLPLPPGVVDACPGAPEKLAIPATRLAGRVRGSAGPDAVVVGKSAGPVAGLGDDDCVFAKQGSDSISGGPGNDVVSGGRGADRLNCGPGRDTAIADRRDTVAKNCERVKRARR